MEKERATMADKQESLVMSIPELATKLEISKGLCYALAKTDRLPVPVIRCGKRLLISHRALMDLLEGNGNKNG